MVVLIYAYSADPSGFNSEKNMKNWSAFAEVITKIKVGLLFLRHCVCGGYNYDSTSSRRPFELRSLR